VVFLGLLLKVLLQNFLFFFALFFITTEFIPVVIELFLPKEIPNLNALFSGLPDSIWYFLSILQIPTGITLVISAMLARFIIRRLPIIG
jgi:putative phage-related membrane protein